jgi:hypothetical protein
MSISNLPVELQGIIQKNMLQRLFQEGLRSKLAFRMIADREIFPGRIGETLTKTRHGLKNPATTPIDPSVIDSNLDNGLTPSNFTVEQYKYGISLYADTIDLNSITSQVEIAGRFSKNVTVTAVQAAQTLERLARNKIYDGYMGANSWVTETLVAAGPTIKVDDVRHFNEIFVNGELVPVSASNKRNVTVGGSVYALQAVAIDAVNTSKIASFGGQSGTLTFDANVSIADGTLGNGVIAESSAIVLRPNVKESTYLLDNADILTMEMLQDAVAILRNNAVPTIGGVYNCYLDQNSMKQLYRDQEFRELFRGRPDTREYRQGIVVDLLGLRFISTTETYQQTLTTATGPVRVKRPIISGQGALIEGTFAEQDAMIAQRNRNAVIRNIDGVVSVTRPPLDRLGMNIGQSWYWIGGYALPTDSTATQSIIPTSNNSYYKRAVVLETA